MLEEDKRKISSEIAYKKLESGTLLVDIRTSEEREEELIPGSIWIPHDLLSQYVHKLKEEQEVIFYCHSGRRSTEACKSMENLGLSNISSLAGGIVEWQTKGLPISTGVNELTVSPLHDTNNDIKHHKLK